MGSPYGDPQRGDFEDALKQRGPSYPPGSVARVGLGGRFLSEGFRLVSIWWIRQTFAARGSFRQVGSLRWASGFPRCGRCALADPFRCAVGGSFDDPTRNDPIPLARARRQDPVVTHLMRTRWWNEWHQASIRSLRSIRMWLDAPRDPP
jgi:hypothetical protein